MIRAFCNAFPDCTLWRGHDLDWMLVGTRDGKGPVGVERVRRQWEDPRVGADLRDVGLETPEQMGALFLADAKALARLAGSEPPVTDNWPGRVGRQPRALPTALRLHGAPRRAPPGRIVRGQSRHPALVAGGTAVGDRGGHADRVILSLMFVERMAERPPAESWLHEVMTTSQARLPCSCGS